MNIYDKQEFKKTYKNISVLFFMVMLLLLVIIVGLNFILDKSFSWSHFSDQVITSLIGVMIPLVLFNIVFDHFTKVYHQKEVSDRITETLIFNKEVINHFSEESKNRFIKSSVESLLGDDHGNMLYNSLISPYLNNVYSFRSNFKYYISYTEKETFSFGDTTFEESDYYWVDQELSFTKNIKNEEYNKEELFVGFSYKESTLDALYGRADFFFRENLWVEDHHIEMLQGMTNDEMMAFVRDVLQFNLEINDEPLEFTVRNDKEIEGFYLNVKIPKHIQDEDLDELRFKITFQMPQFKKQKKFIVMISEPTHSVDVMFSHIRDKVNVVAIPFFDDSNAIRHLPNDLIKVELDKWVLPRAGIVFVWDEQEE